MEKENKKNVIIIVLLCIIFLLIGAIIGAVCYNKFGKNITSPKEDKEVETFPQNIVGEWGICDGEYSCNGLIVAKEGDVYYYTPYRMWSDGGQRGEITSTTKVEDNIWKITVHYEGFENELASAPEETLEYTIDTAKLLGDILYVNNEKYQKIVGDREAFFTSIMK